MKPELHEHRPAQRSYWSDKVVIPTFDFFLFICLTIRMRLSTLVPKLVIFV